MTSGPAGGCNSSHAFAAASGGTSKVRTRLSLPAREALLELRKTRLPPDRRVPARLHRREARTAKRDPCPRWKRPEAVRHGGPGARRARRVPCMDELARPLDY